MGLGCSDLAHPESSSNGTPCLLSYLLFKLTLGDDHFVREEISNHYVVHQELTVLQINYTSKTNTQRNKLIEKGVRYAVPGVRFWGQGTGWRQSNVQTSKYEGQGHNQQPTHTLNTAACHTRKRWREQIPRVLITRKNFFYFASLWDHRCSFNFLWSFMTYVSHITMSHTLFRAVHQFHTNTTRRKKCQRAHPDFMEPKTYTESLFNKYNTKKLICKLPKKICYHVSPLLGSLPGP